MGPSLTQGRIVKENRGDSMHFKWFGGRTDIGVCIFFKSLGTCPNLINLFIFQYFFSSCLERHPVILLTNVQDNISKSYPVIVILSLKKIDEKKIQKK